MKCKIHVLLILLLWAYPLPFVFGQAIIPDGTIPAGLGVQLKGHNDDPKNLAHIADAGFTWVRRGFIM